MRVATAVSSRTGIYFGWWVVFASASIVFLTGGTFFYGFGAIFNPIVHEFGWSRASVSLAFSLRSEVSGLAAPAVGFLVDRVGSRRLMMTGVTLVALGFMLLSRIESLWGFYGSIFVIAIGISATGGPVGMVAIAHWFKKRRGRALAVMTAGAGASGVMVLVLDALISAFGWRDALFIMGVVQLAVCFPLAMSVRNRPSEMGMRAEDEQGEGEAPGPAATPEGLTVGQALRTATFWKLSLAIALANLGMTAIIVHQIPFLTSSAGVSSGLAAASVTGMTLLSLVGRLGFGQLADVMDKRQVLAGSFALAGLSLLLFASVHHPWQALYAIPVFALGFGGLIPVRPAFQAEYFGLRAFGAIQGLVFTISMLGSLVGPVFAGWVYDETGSYRLAFVLLSLGALLAAPLILSAGKPSQTQSAGRAA